MRVCIVDLCRSYTDHTSILYDTIYIYNYIHRSIGLSFIRNSIDADYAEAGAANHLTQLEPGQGTPPISELTAYLENAFRPVCGLLGHGIRNPWTLHGYDIVQTKRVLQID